MRILLLGPAELLSGDGVSVHLGGVRRRALLAALALRINRFVDVEPLADIVWDGAPPPRARPALQGHVAALRRLLPGDLTLETRGSSYRLAGDPELVDCHRFEALVASGALERALLLWRGPALADLASGSFFRSHAERLRERRLLALETWAGEEIERGTGGRMTPYLREAVHEAPLRESLLSAYLLCLHQDGRQSEAIELYHRSRELLDAELGVHPGAEMQAAFTRVLRDPPQADPFPPRPLVVGRTESLAWLSEVCAGGSPPAVVVGPAGVGKTTLVLAWAHDVRERFPDGLLFADLGGASPGEAPARFLERLGEGVPASPEARAALFRTVTAERRVLVVLDDAPDAASVRPLLPYGPGCAAVVTSRVALLDLAVAENGALRTLAPLSGEEAVALLSAHLGASRVLREPEAAARLAVLCDGLPSALLSLSVHTRLSDLVAELEDPRTRLERLGVAEALDVTRRRLPPEARRLIPLLGLHPDHMVTAHAAARLLGSSFQAAREALGTLAAHHFLVESRPGHFTLPALTALYCRRAAASELGRTDTRQS